MHEEGVEHLGADVERIVRLQARVHVRRVAAQDGARQQHAERLAADRTGADHARADGDQVVQRQVFADQPPHRAVVGDDQPGETLEPFGFRRIGIAGAACRHD